MRARQNPFRIERVHALEFRFTAGDGLDAVWQRLQGRRGRGAIVGPHGTGKTTLLGQLAERMRADGHRVRAVRIGRGRARLNPTERDRLCADIRPSDAVLLDGAGHLLPWEWWRVRLAARRAGFLVITAHRAGRLPTLLRTSPSPGLLVDLTLALGAPVSHCEAERLFRDARGNLRDALRALYDAHAGGSAGTESRPFIGRSAARARRSPAR